MNEERLLETKLKDIENVVNSQQKKRIRITRGILDGRMAYTGPIQVEICVSDLCNNSCLACWQYSPLIKKGYSTYFDPNKRNKLLQFDIFKKAVDDLHDLDVQIIRITGMGEPLQNPDIIDMVRYVKSYGIFCSINTNGTLITREMIDKFCQIGLDRIDLSLWAGSAKAYVETHPNQSEKTFYHIKDWLNHLADIKHSYNNKPDALLINVIFNKNYNDVENMIKFAIETRVNRMYLNPVDTNENTRELLLNKEELDVLRCNVKNSISQLKDSSLRHNICGFLESLNCQGASDGKFDFNIYDNNYRCYHGWVHSRILADGRVVPCGFTNNLVMGDINEKSFKEIWNSDKYQEFREKCIIGMNDDYFSTSCCQRNCVYFRVNQRIHEGICVVKNNMDNLKIYPSSRNIYFWLKEIDPILERKMFYNY
ncbi:MAG: radical SAM protein [Candidatus Aenigmatarchaeota archaeon]